MIHYFFVMQSTQNIVTIKSILRGFELTSGLRINFHKSYIGVLGIGRDEFIMFSIALNCRQMSIPFKYLGITVGDNSRNTKFWDEVAKIKNKLSKWKDKSLSFVGRLYLIKFVLFVVPLFYLIFVQCPIISKQQHY